MLNTANVTAYGGGNMSKQHLASFKQELERGASGGRRRKVKLEAPSAKSFAEMGAAVEVRKK